MTPPASNDGPGYRVIRSPASTRTKVRGVTEASMPPPTSITQQRVACRERARERRREDQDARERPWRLAHAKEPGPQLAEQPHPVEARPGRHAEQAFDATPAEGAPLGELAGIEVEFGLDTQQRKRVPCEPSAEPEVAAVELFQRRGDDLPTGIERRVAALSRGGAPPRQQHRRTNHERAKSG